ncbi:hypothetical protein BDA96_05G044100 [Sorghum bicolor]|uniref:Uncharacterized protein n=2 Tax=Sorghum bicolor TaxID=4558 RepID=A0A921QXB3_SORBI|nr:hypothetical protein BDA96_05G044100 [Sorghum bicolor]KXG27774.1 hypothetical protein SORBI_3005G041900 [Sorghum bicolor]
MAAPHHSLTLLHCRRSFRRSLSSPPTSGPPSATSARLVQVVLLTRKALPSMFSLIGTTLLQLCSHKPLLQYFLLYTLPTAAITAKWSR